MGIGSGIYGTMEIIEGAQEIYYGSQGDITTKSINPIRDTVFFGNSDVYHQTGQFFVLGASILTPIQATGSVSQGLWHFSFSTMGGMAGSQAAYQGVKLFGGSDKDAQTASIFGGFLGSYVSASAANKFSLNNPLGNGVVPISPNEGVGKFSLNKPVKNFKDPELMEQLAKSGYKYNADNVVLVTKNSDGKLLWLETGTDKAGLQHIILRHSEDFNRLSINDIPAFLDEALGLSPIKTGTGSRGLYSIYEINGRRYTLAYGNNGFIVSFYPSK